jgi:hypothetical protein
MSRQFTYYGSFASAAYFTDLFGVPAAAYSLRKLSPNSVYAGAAIRVRRSSDNTEQDINFVSSSPNAGIDTSALLSFVGAGNGFVTTWYNQNGSSSSLTQTTAGNQPRIVSGGVVETNGGLPSVFFITATPFSGMVNNAIAGRANLTSFRVHDTSRTQYLTWRGSGANQFNYAATLSSTNTTIFADYGTPQLFVNGIAPSPLTNRGHVYTAQNGRKLISEIGTTIGWVTFQVGLYTNFQFAGHLPELIFYYSDQLSQRTAIETNINDYYNVF